MNSTLKNISLRIPSSIYYANPYASVRSIIGNDVEIINIKPSNVILNDSTLLINVDYSSIDFDLFKIYEVIETKILSQQSSETIATKIKDVDSGEIIEKNIILYDSNINTESKKNKYIFIKFIDNINYINIKYYGEVVNSSNVLHSYCSIVDTKFLSYHGTSIKHTKNFEKATSEKLGILLPKTIKSEISTDSESKAYYKLITTSPNNYTNSNFELSNIYLKFGYNNTTELNSIKLKDISNVKNISIISLCDYTIDDINKYLLNQHGIIIISKYRENPLSIIFIPSDSDIITKDNITALLLVIDYDIYNLSLISK